MRELTRIGLLADFAQTDAIDSGAADPNVMQLPMADGGGSTALDTVFNPPPVYTFNPGIAPAPAPLPVGDPVQAPQAPPAPFTNVAPSPVPGGAVQTIDPATDTTPAPAFDLMTFIKSNPWLIVVAGGTLVLIIRNSRKKKRRARK